MVDPSQDRFFILFTNKRSYILIGINVFRNPHFLLRNWPFNRHDSRMRACDRKRACDVAVTTTTAARALAPTSL